MRKLPSVLLTSGFILASTIAAPAAVAQVAPPPAQAEQGRGRGGAAPAVVSPEVSSDRRITFRINAPQAQTVRVSGSDIPGLGQNGVMTKSEGGVWTFTSAPVPPGAYRYNINVDGVAVIDPRNPLTSVSNNNVWSLALVSGSDIFDTKDVPHGAVASITYYSTPLARHRRMHVYTPPGYEANSAKYPVFYLLHGAGDVDDSWGTVGRAGFILDNLIAAGKARPRLVVMPAGHTGPFRFGGSGPDEFAQAFVNALMPYVEANYRVKTDRISRAMGGLWMGGGQTLNTGVPHLD